MFARAAFCDVTPRGLKVQLAGYAARRLPASRVLDRIEVSAVLLEDGERRCLIFSFDLMIIGAELDQMIREKLLGRGFSFAEIVLLASHTHSAPATDRACERLGVAEPEIVEAFADAVETLVREIEAQRRTEIDLNVLQGQLNHSINRRRYWPFPTFGRTYGFRLTSISMAPNRGGPRNEQATCLLIRGADDKQVLAILWHYTCHPTSVADNVISADFPGAVRAALRQRFGEIPCIFLQGFCGDIRPNITSSLRPTLRERLRSLVRTIASGPAFPRHSTEDAARWRQNLAARVCEIAQSGAARIVPLASLQTGSASIPLDRFFQGSVPAKPLTAQIVRIGALEIIALSAEACIGWEAIIGQAFPAAPGQIRLHAGYLGALFGYLPTAAQIAEGGYEVTGFQPLFGLSGRFLAERIGAAVIGCVTDAFDDLESDSQPEAITARPSAGA